MHNLLEMPTTEFLAIFQSSFESWREDNEFYQGIRTTFTLGLELLENNLCINFDGENQILKLSSYSTGCSVMPASFSNFVQAKLSQSSFTNATKPWAKGHASIDYIVP